MHEQIARLYVTHIYWKLFTDTKISSGQYGIHIRHRGRGIGGVVVAGGGGWELGSTWRYTIYSIQVMD